MKNPLNRQITEYDCGPASVLNALSYLFDREEIPPELPKHIMAYCLDMFDEYGETGKSGTSKVAMFFLSSWLNHYAEVKNFSIECAYIKAGEVNTSKDGRLLRALRNGGVAVVRLLHDCSHYVLFTSAGDGCVEMFDPYYDEEFTADGIEVLNDPDGRKNRRVKLEVLERKNSLTYALGELAEREAILFFNKAAKTGDKKEIEYFI